MYLTSPKRPIFRIILENKKKLCSFFHTGLVLKSPSFKQLETHELHKDDIYWETPDGHQHEN